MTIDLSAVRTTARRQTTGPVHRPGEPGYDAARAPWAAAADLRPAAVATPRTAEEVVAVVRSARDAGLRVAPQSTGHNAGPLAAQDLSDVVLLRTGALNDVTVDPARGIARVGGGTIWQPVVEAAAEHGLAALHGSSPDVGIAGYSLGGGTGWYARKLGLQTNSLTAVELVTADGELLRTDAGHEPHLFWALRGGGGGFGVVTALEFGLYPIRSAYAGMLVWDAADAEPVLRTWAAWAPSAPDEVTTSFRMMRIPDMPGVPPFLAGRHLAVIDGAVLGTDEDAREILGDLRALRPELDTFARVPAHTLSRLHMDPEEPTPVASGTALLGSLPDAGVDAFLAEVGPGTSSSLLMAELRQLGGALGRPHEGGGALKQFDGDFLAFGGAVAATPETAAAGRADAAMLMGRLSPWANGKNYLNFAEEPVDPRTGFDDDTWALLSAIRTAVDPARFFVPNHRVGRYPADR